MGFQIPRNLGHFSADGLRDLHAQATAEYNEVFAAANANNRANLTQEHVDTLAALREFRINVETRLATFGADTTSLDPTTDDTTPPSVQDVAAGQEQDTPQAERADRAYMVASAGSARAESGQRISLDEAGAVLREKLDGLVGVSGHGQVPTFAIRKPINPELHFTGGASDREILEHAADETRLPDGSLMAGFANAQSLTASSGWCAVSETDYSITTSYARDGLLDVPRTTAPRGGLRWYPELLFGTVYGGFTGTNFFNLTEAQVEAGTPKTFVEVGCPSITELRLGVSGLGVVTNLLPLRALPEYTNKFISGALLGLEYYQNALNIAAIVAGSTAVDISAQNPFASDGSVFSVILPAAEMAAVDIRASKMLPLDATIEMVFPIWTLAQIRADLARREGMTDPWVQDAWIISKFTQLNIRPQFVRNYQDAWSGAGGTGLGQATRILALPTTIKFLAYPAGTWVRAEEDVIRVSTVYDSVRLAGNQRIELFQEFGWRMIPRLTGSYEYEVDICASGGVGNHHTITCGTG